MITRHVCPSGDDRWSGTLPEPNAARTDGPFATLRAARDAVRLARGIDVSRDPSRRSAGGPDAIAGPPPAGSPAATVLLGGGTYRLDVTLRLDTVDGGFADARVTWRAAPGGHPVLSGGVAMREWKPWREGILRAPLPPRAAWAGTPRQLFHKGRRLRRSRWPKFDPANPVAGGWIFPEGPVEDLEYLALHWPAGSFPRRWEKPRLAEAVIYGGWGWCTHVIPLADLDAERRVLRLRREPIREDVQPWYFTLRLGPANRFYVENVREEIAEPGEWCADTEEGWLYLAPPADFDPATVEIPVLDCLVGLRGTQHLSLEGISFTCTTTGDDYHRFGVQGVGAMVSQPGWRYCGEALHLRATRGCVVERCRFVEVGGNAVYLEGGTVRCAVRRCEVDGPGANGVVLAGDRAFHPLACEVADNDVHHVGSLVNLTAGVFLGLSDGCRVEHNSLHDLPHHAVNLGANGTGRNWVELNDIRRVCLANHDVGAINCWMDVPSPWVEADAERSGHVIRWNRIEDVPGYRVEHGRLVEDATTRGIYLDDFASNCVVQGNVVIRAGMGFQVHGGKHNLVEGNVFVDCRHVAWLCDYVAQRPGLGHMLASNRANRVQMNIFSSSREDAFGYWIHLFHDELLERCDANLYHLPRSREPWVRWEAHPAGLASSSVEEWRAAGFDANAVFADPRFVDPARGDYRLAPDSPAHALGFAPIPFERIGIRPEPRHKAG
jgi:hypothetical protein